MSLSPPNPGRLSSAETEQKNTPAPPDGSRPSYSGGIGWQRRLLRISIALFTFEVGIFLVIFPWTDHWDLNYFQSLTPTLQTLWQNDSFRGAITGLGFVNIYIACLQAVHSFRRS